MNELTIKEELKVENMIYEIRGKQVMLDSDLAKLYECSNGTKDINKAVNRNIERFPDDFYFQLSNLEYSDLKFQIGTSRLNGHGGIRKLPYVFTEQGVAMLATILHTKVAAEISVRIMRAFVAMRQYISNSLLSNPIEYKFLEYDKRIEKLEETFDNFKEKNNHIFFEGQIYDAYSLLMDILNQSKEEIIIIDNYAGKELLDLLKNIDKKITIVSKNINEELINKYNKQYSNVKFIINNSFHDRFIIIDNKILYNCGSSFKDLGKKCFAINKIEDIELLEKIMKNIIYLLNS